jgi:hypothetical protein
MISPEPGTLHPSPSFCVLHEGIPNESRACIFRHQQGDPRIDAELPDRQRFGIHVDPQDSLLVQGEEGYQLTWMDAKVGDWVVTPRRGKAVEINALWYNALCLQANWLAQYRQLWNSGVSTRRRWPVNIADRGGAHGVPLSIRRVSSHEPILPISVYR